MRVVIIYLPRCSINVATTASTMAKILKGRTKDVINSRTSVSALNDNLRGKDYDNTRM